MRVVYLFKGKSYSSIINRGQLDVKKNLCSFYSLGFRLSKIVLAYYVLA